MRHINLTKVQHLLWQGTPRYYRRIEAVLSIIFFISAQMGEVCSSSKLSGHMDTMEAWNNASSNQINALLSQKGSSIDAYDVGIGMRS